MRWLWLLIAFIVGVVIDSVFGIPLLDLIKPIFKLLSYQWSIIIGLVIVAIFLLLLIDGARRFHERSVKQLNNTHEEEITERRRLADILHRLSIVYGMALQASNIINFFHGSLPKDRLEYLDADINSTIFHCFGVSERDNYYQNMIEVPDSPDEQSWWIRSHCEKLSALIDRHQKQLVARKEAIKK